MEGTNPKRVQKEGRTVEWVEQQSAVRYSSVRYDPPPSPTLPSSSTVSMSRTSSSTTRTTSGSEQSFAGQSTLKRRGVPPSPSLMNPVPSPITPVSSSSHERAFPFPQSPPGSGYPMVLQVDPPRVDTVRPTRPSLLKKRRPSLVDQVKSFGSSSVPWKRDDSSKR
ncbi:hypothetical protein PHLGIDRAFT_19578 [Phlebiopsis gigantea 11061_1 CR5-6]|uniref:Uncharacterized protein n=1 Tax=Phlebiopsis gigantea (strain 11061_1 CR5-6) TaxID=745531 RepID=A0A0C3S973_PHLG1|nr:hypothetical protein PHLGIDRAFT_19578 [Phlebiopsis gigantea 11061_1 CR5-6]